MRKHLITWLLFAACPEVIGITVRCDVIDDLCVKRSTCLITYPSHKTCQAQNGTYEAIFFDPLSGACGRIRPAFTASAMIREAVE